MTFRRQLYYTLPTIFMLVLCCEADLATVVGDNSISNLYENLLQREYPGPVVFPNHQVERKAQRSPSLRLRFGRRNDPDLMPSAEKRWFGDVRQKPIRSPSLRLRFGRRSDPTMPLHSSFDILMNNLAAGGDGNGIANFDEYAFEQDYDAASDVAGGGAAYEAGYERAVRKPQRLRWGRSVPTEWSQNDKEFENDQHLQGSDEILSSLMNTEKFQNWLMNLRRYNDVDGPIDSFASDEFAREARKPGPLRLRWGRSTAGASHLAQNVSAEKVAQDKQPTQNSNAEAEKSLTLKNIESKN